MWVRIAWFHMWENAGLREQQGTAARVLRETHWFLPLVYVSIILRLGVLGFLQCLVWHSAIWRKRNKHLWEHWGCYGIIVLFLHQRSRSNYTQLFIMSNTDWTPCWCQKKRDTAMALLFCILWLAGKVVWVLTHLLHALVPPQSTNGTSSDHRVFPQAQKYIRVPMGIPLLCNVVWWKSLWEVRIIHSNIGVTSKDMSK